LAISFYFCNNRQICLGHFPDSQIMHFGTDKPV
jgi:hypothetical protein